ncbi:MAG: hypothetical protein AAGD01_06690 [Acidobacteriota bacterium]
MSSAPLEAKLVTAAEAPAGELDLFLQTFFGATKAAFLRDHGSWWHRGDENRLVLLVDGRVAAYTGVIPTTVRRGQEELEGAWWMDLVVAPAFRRRGLERRLDAEVRRRFRWILGFPNALAAKIHRRHRWGVKEDLKVHLLPLEPRRMPALQRGDSILSRALRSSAATLATPLAHWHRRRLLPSTPAVKTPPQRWVLDAEALARVASTTPTHSAAGAPWLTAARRAEDFSWRYLEAPPSYREGLRLHVDDEDSPRLAVISRHTGRGARILDLFGDLRETGRVIPLLRRAAASAAAEGEPQVTALAGNGLISSTLRRAGFLITSTARFCWLGTTADQTESLAPCDLHWNLGDSDNDEPR